MTDIHQALEETGKRTEWVRVRRWRQRPTDDGVVTEVPPSEIIEAARNLEGVEDIELLGPLIVVDRNDAERDVALETGRYLIIPLQAVADARRTEEST